jgi:hypothetical protein
MLRDASNYLLARLKEKRLHGQRPQSIGNVDLDIYAAHALALAYGQDPQQYQQSLDDLRAVLTRIDGRRPLSPLLDRVLLCDTWRLLGDRPRAAAELERLAQNALPKRGDGASICATAALVELGAALEPRDARWRLLARQLISARTGSGWGDTLCNSAAVRGLAAVLAAPRAGESPVVVRIDGRQVGALTAARGNRIELKLPRIGVLTLHPAMPLCEDFYEVRVEGFTASPPAAAAAPQATLRTRVFQLQPARRELAPSASGRLALAPAVTYEMQIEVELRQPVSHARLTLPRPCGMELVRLPKRTGGVAAVEARDDALHFFIDRWEAGRQTILFPIRVELTGTISAPPPELVPMYGDSLPTSATGATEWVVRQPCR